MKCPKCDMHMENVHIYDDGVNGFCDCTTTHTYASDVVPLTWGMHEDYFIAIGATWGDSELF
jgi:hypothetical protein